MNKLTKSVSKRVVHSDEQRSQLNALQALIEAEKDELIEIGLRFQREHEAMIAEIVAELNVARRRGGTGRSNVEAVNDCVPLALPVQPCVECHTCRVKPFRIRLRLRLAVKLRKHQFPPRGV